MGLPICRGEVTSPQGFLQRRVSYPTFCFILDVREIFKNKQGRSFERPYSIKHRQKVNPLTRVEGNLGLPSSPRRGQCGVTRFVIHSSNEQTNKLQTLLLGILPEGPFLFPEISRYLQVILGKSRIPVFRHKDWLGWILLFKRTRFFKDQLARGKQVVF